MKRKIQIFFSVALLFAGLRLAWVFYQRHESDKAANNAATSAPAHKMHSDDYVYLRPSHVYDLASTKKFLVGKTVWVKAGNAVAYSSLSSVRSESNKVSVLPPLAELKINDVFVRGTQMMAQFTFTSPKLSGGYFVPIGSIKNGDANIIIDDLFYFEDPHKLYADWTKDQWAAIERHEITQGMSEAMAQASMGVPHVPESGATGDYGNRTLVFTDPQHPDKPVTVRFVDNAAVSISR